MTSSGVDPASSSNRSSGRSTPCRPAIATRWMTALVEPPIAWRVRIAFSNASRVMMSEGRVPAATRSMIWAPARSATCRRRESTAGIAALPAGAIPSASVRQAIVDAVPIGEQCPSLRHIPASNSSQSACVIRSARSSSWSRQQSVHAPTCSLRKRPLSIGPPVTISAGTSTLAAPIRLAGIVLSQLARRTTPSTRIAADQLLDGHRHQVPVEHRGRLDDRLAERDHRDLDGEATRAQHAALHVLREVAQVRVAPGHLAPAVEDPDHRPAGERLLGEPLHPELRYDARCGRGRPCPTRRSCAGPVRRQVPRRLPSVSRSLAPMHRMICQMELAMKELYPLSGVMAIPQTPFDDADRVDLDSFARGVADRLAAGVDGLLYPVVASEVSRLTDRERRTLTRAILDQAAGRVPVFVGASADDAATVRALAEFAADARRRGRARPGAGRAAPRRGRDGRLVPRGVRGADRRPDDPGPRVGRPRAAGGDDRPAVRGAGAVPMHQGRDGPGRSEVHGDPRGDRRAADRGGGLGGPVPDGGARSRDPRRDAGRPALGHRGGDPALSRGRSGRRASPVRSAAADPRLAEPAHRHLEPVPEAARGPPGDLRRRPPSPARRAVRRRPPAHRRRADRRRDGAPRRRSAGIRHESGPLARPWRRPARRGARPDTGRQPRCCSGSRRPRSAARTSTRSGSGRSRCRSGHTRSTAAWPR